MQQQEPVKISQKETCQIGPKWITKQQSTNVRVLTADKNSPHHNQWLLSIITKFLKYWFDALIIVVVVVFAGLVLGPLNCWG